jgi:hypothetical protein
VPGSQLPVQETGTEADGDDIVFLSAPHVNPLIRKHGGRGGLYLYQPEHVMIVRKQSTFKLHFMSAKPEKS